MIGQSSFDYYFIKLCIIGLHYLAPLCLLYCALVVGYYGPSAAIRPFPLLVETVAVAESLFYLLGYLPYRYYLQREAIHPSAPTRDERRALFQLCNDNITNPEAYLRKWFLGVELKAIKRENLKEFFLWAFFNRGGPPGEDNEELEEYVEMTEKLLGQKIEEGTGNVACLRLTLDEVDILHRSLIWYFCVGFVDFLTYTRLLLDGFHFYRMPLSRFFTLFPFRPVTLFTRHRSPVKHTTYWHRPHTSTTKLPVVFIHGIGIGLYPYTNFLRELNSIPGLESADPNEQVGIIAIEIMPVSFRITNHMLSREEMCTEIDQILLKHFSPTQKFVLVSHSYGTVISTHLLKQPSIASRIGPVVLIDPVSILLHLPDVAYNFTRRKPKEANEHQLYYFASMDPGVSHTLSRHFFWNENVLWKQDLEGRNVTVSLSGRDLIVDTEAVGRYLAQGFPAKGQNSQDSGVLVDVDSLDETHSRGVSMRGGDEVLSATSASTLNEPDEDAWKTREWKGTGIDIIWSEHLDHAQIFDTAVSRRRVIGAIRSYCEDSS